MYTLLYPCIEANDDDDDSVAVPPVADNDAIPLLVVRPTLPVDDDTYTPPAAAVYDDDDAGEELSEEGRTGDAGADVSTTRGCERGSAVVFAAFDGWNGSMWLICQNWYSIMARWWNWPKGAYVIKLPCTPYYLSYCLKGLPYPNYKICTKVFTVQKSISVISASAF